MNDEATRLDFIREIIKDDLRTGKHSGIVTRFPPEPNGYLHIGHSKAISVNFGIAAEFGGRCHLRFDDTNPTKEELEYIESIEEDVRWLGYDWGEHLYHASDYFEQLFQWKNGLVKTRNTRVASYNRYDCSPNTHLMLSAIFDLPLPFGPTIEVTFSANSKSVWLAKVL